MIPQTFEYSAPKTLEEALQLLAGGAKALAGGMSLIPMMKLRLATPEHLVDLARIKDLNYIREAAGNLHIGATATHYAVESSSLVRAKCPLLAATAAAIGDVQVRNTGTVGGSIAHNDPSADYPAALQALEAKIVIRGADGERTVPADEFIVDAFTTTLEPGEIVRELIVPIEGADVRTSYQKAPQPASGFAMVGIAVRAQKSGGQVVLANIGVTGLSNRAYRASAAEKAIIGTAGSAADIQATAALVAQGVDANSDLHASADYRKHLASVYTARALTATLG
ncbi:MAG: xanthine dehydrogenase family protein subunit M [Bryobacteraceae bacterium]